MVGTYLVPPQPVFDALVGATAPQLGDPPCPDIGQRLARFLVLRAIGRSYSELERAFNLSYEQVRLLLARHGEPPRLAGAQAADMKRALEAAQMAGPVEPAFATHAAHTHAALENDQESA
jgi:hypothetical protein